MTQSHGVALAPLTWHNEGHVSGSCSHRTHVANAVSPRLSVGLRTVFPFKQRALWTPRASSLCGHVLALLFPDAWGETVAPYGDLSFKDVQTAVSPHRGPSDDV